MERKLRRKVIKIVNKNLDGIYSSAKDIAKEWDKKTIPLTTLKVIIDKSKPKPVEDKDIEEFNDKYRITLNELYKACESISKKMDSKSIPLTQLYEGIRIIKQSFAQGLSLTE